jgi:hypothetical protein
MLLIYKIKIDSYIKVTDYKIDPLLFDQLWSMIAQNLSVNIDAEILEWLGTNLVHLLACPSEHADFGMVRIVVGGQTPSTGITVLRFWVWATQSRPLVDTNINLKLSVNIDAEILE